MKSLLFRLFIENWPRKLVSLILAVIVWMMVSHSMTVSKVVQNIPVRVVNLPLDKTIEGMQLNGYLSKRVSLTLIGHKSALEEISAKDFEILIDAKDKSHEWIASIEKKHLVSLNADLDIDKQISRILPTELIIRQSKLISDRIPITVTQPIGEVPKGYQFLDIYPSQLSVSVNGPEEAVKRLKTRGLKLTFNLNDLRQEDLDALQSAVLADKSDEISFFVPDSWKKISLPLLSETPIEIDDPLAKTLRIDFSRQDLLPIGFSIPVTVFFPPKYSNTLNPETYPLAPNDFIAKKNGIKVFNAPLYAQGVSRLFLETVKDRIEMVIIASPKSERETLLWNAQFLSPHELEDRYVAKVMAESNDIVSDAQPHLIEESLRNRFRSYMNRFRLYTPNNRKLSLKIELQANAISVTAQNYP
ncbi:MAG: CdaR family protein [Chlamydiales bacterium]